MNSKNDCQPIILIHQPYGELHPYEPLPFERSPRVPIAGEPVDIGISTRSILAVEKVCCWYGFSAEDLDKKIEAEKISSDDSSDHWKAVLPAFNPNSTIYYRIIAENQENQASSNLFSFNTSSWVTLNTVVHFEQNKDDLDLIIATGTKDLYVYLHVEFDDSGNLKFRYSSDLRENLGIELKEIDKLQIIDFGDFQFQFSNQPFNFQIKRKSDGLELRTLQNLKVLVQAGGQVMQYQIEFESPDDEAFYGFGERFNALNQRGQRLDNRVYGQYTNQGKRTYIPIPFFLSSRGYGFWLRTDQQAYFDLASANPMAWSVTGYAERAEGELQIEIFLQDDPKKIIQGFVEKTGKPKIPPAWVFGLWMSSNDWNSQAEVMKQLGLTEKYQIPATVLVIEAWSDEINFYIWNDAQYKIKPSSESYALKDFHFPPEGKWPDPKRMIDSIHNAGMRLVLWQNPILKHGSSAEHLDETQNQLDQVFAIEKGYVIRKADGTPHFIEPHMPWFGNSLVLDFSNPDAVDWWFTKREYLVAELGVDGFKTDGGEHIWDTETCFHNGLRGDRGINNYPIYYTAAYQKFCERHHNNDYVLFSRAGYTGSQTIPCHWAGDEKSTWQAFRATIRALLNAGICGLPFIGWDIAGFAGPIPTSELYLRATAFSVFCPIMQYHSDVNGRKTPSRDRTPWNIQDQTGDPNIIPVFRNYSNLRMNLLPYIVEQARDCSKTGLPLMRALPIEYPADKKCQDYPYEYLFGDALLIAPIVDEGVTTSKVYLPEGEWFDFWNGRLFKEPIEIEMPCRIDQIPVFQRNGSLVALNLDDSLELFSPVGNSTKEIKNLALRISPSGSAEYEVFQGEDQQYGRILVSPDSMKKSIDIQIHDFVYNVDLFVCGEGPRNIFIDGEKIPSQSEVRGKNSQYWKRLTGRNMTHIHVFKTSNLIKIE